MRKLASFLPILSVDQPLAVNRLMFADFRIQLRSSITTQWFDFVVRYGRINKI